MPFDDFQKHCTECKKSEPCGKYHLYVMKLDQKIYEGFKKQGIIIDNLYKVLKKKLKRNVKKLQVLTPNIINR